MYYRTRKTKSNPKFYKIYFGVIIACLVLLIVAVFILRSFLTDFEKAQPKYVAEEVFEQYFVNGERSVLEKMDVQPGEFEQKEAAEKYAEDLLKGGELTYSEVSNGLDSGKKYVVKKDGERIFNFTLKERGEKSSFGLKLYELDGISMVSGSTSITAEVPQGYVLYVNGKPVDQKYITESGLKTDVFEYLPDDVNAPLNDKYVVSDLFEEPTVTADNGAGKPAEIERDEKTGIYKVGLVYSEELQQEFSEYVLEAARTYAAYMQSDMYFYRVARYLDPNSELYSLTRDTITGFVIDHNGYSFEDESASEFVAYDENTFSCRVKLTHKLHKWGADDYVEYLDMTMFLHNVNGQYLIFDRFNTN